VGSRKQEVYSVVDKYFAAVLALGEFPQDEKTGYRDKKARARQASTLHQERASRDLQRSVDYNLTMQRSAIIALLMLAIVVSPTLSFAVNTAALTKAQSCCDEMRSTCANGESPQSCCKTSLVQVEPSNLVRSVVIAADLHYSSNPAEPGTVPAIEFLSRSTARCESPPPRSSPPLVLRI
jgi:hypothetical protein